MLQCSLEAFVELGYHATTVREIARRLNQTVPTIYYYYENKQALLVALLDESIDDLLDRCRQAKDWAGDDPVQALSALVRCLALFVMHRPQLTLLDQEIRSLEPANRGAYVAKRDVLEAMLVDCIADGVKNGVFRVNDTRTAARALLSMCRGIATWYRMGGAMNPDELADEYVRFALGLTGYRG